MIISDHQDGPPISTFNVEFVVQKRHIFYRSCTFRANYTAKMTAFIGTTFKYPIPSPTENLRQPRAAHTARSLAPALTAVGTRHPPTCIRRRMTSNGYEAVCVGTPESALIAKNDRRLSIRREQILQ